MRRFKRLNLKLSSCYSALYKAFNVGFGDFILYAESDKGTVTTLRFEGCYYHGGRICFRGAGITKAGKVGKRDASFYLSLMATP